MKEGYVFSNPTLFLIDELLDNVINDLSIRKNHYRILLYRLGEPQASTAMKISKE
jgi:hypothetical protein